jgi:myo-inositol-1(or 4)-monophosphatase
MSLNLHPMVNVAVKAARAAGSLINRAALDIESVRVSQKKANDFVTEVDQAAEAVIIETLLQAYPGHGIWAEESGTEFGAQDSEFVWIIDPLDGTTNFIHGFPQYCVSIGLKHKNVITQAVIYDPVRNELFTATRGQGAYFNDRRMRVSKRKELAEALIGTGFPFRDFKYMDEYMAVLRKVMAGTAGARRAGAAALDLAYVAAGRLDAFWEIGLAPWDMAAGSLLIQEAGGLVSDFDGDGNYLESGRIVAGNPKVFGQLLQLVAAHNPPK